MAARRYVATSWEAPSHAATHSASADPALPKVRPQTTIAGNTPPANQPDQASKPPKRKGVFRRLLDVFK
jgi:hypothetical protein